MARQSRQVSLDAPRGRSGVLQRTPQPSRDRFGRFSESFARGMGTSGFLIGMTTKWLGDNVYRVAGGLAAGVGILLGVI